MSDTTTDFAKVTQMLDAGWIVRVYKGSMGSYEVRAFHPNRAVMANTRRRLASGMSENANYLRKTGQSADGAVQDADFDGVELMTDDFTPEQALTRMSYKVHGEIL